MIANEQVKRSAFRHHRQNLLAQRLQKNFAPSRTAAADRSRQPRLDGSSAHPLLAPHIAEDRFFTRDVARTKERPDGITWIILFEPRDHRAGLEILRVV